MSSGVVATDPSGNIRGTNGSDIPIASGFSSATGSSTGAATGAAAAGASGGGGGGGVSAAGLCSAREAAPPTPPTAAAPKNASLYSRIASSSLSDKPACQRSPICSKTSVGASAITPIVAPVAARVPTFAPVRFANSAAISLPNNFSGILPRPRVKRSAK